MRFPLIRKNRSIFTGNLGLFGSSFTDEWETHSRLRKRNGGTGWTVFGNSITGNAVDLTKLPSWVESVTMFKGRNPGQFVGADPSNTSYLVDPRDSTGTQ
jgi:hypothetical protein